MNTASGLIAVILWSLSIPLSRSLTEKLGSFSTAALACLIGGTLSILYYLPVCYSQFRPFLKLSPKHLLLCGMSFVLYMIFLYMAIGMAVNRQQMIEVGLINYLWPTLTLIFSMPILKNKASPWLILGIIVSLSGIVLVCMSTGKNDFNIQNSLENLRNNFMPYIFALAAAVLWSLYSNLASRYAELSNKLTVPLFLIASGVVLEMLAVCFHEKNEWDAKTLIELLILAVFPGAFAYILWDCAMRKGNMILVTSFAYLTPLLSTMLICLYLGVTLVAGVWIACALVISGAIICNFSIKKQKHKTIG